MNDTTRSGTDHRKLQHRRLPAVALFAALVALAACGGDGSEELGDGTDDAGLDVEFVEFAPELDADRDRMERRESGLYVEDLQEGDGAEATAGTRVRVHYTGWLPDGTQFDTSREGPEPFAFTLGAGQVIPGWDQGVEGMREGGRRRLVIPPDLAYGSQGAGDVIPPDTPLVFEVEVVEVLEAG